METRNHRGTPAPAIKLVIGLVVGGVIGWICVGAAIAGLVVR